MANKFTPAFFDRLEKESFEYFMEEYRRSVDEFQKMIFNYYTNLAKGKPASKNSLCLMRQASSDLEKFGKQFRKRTIQKEKQNVEKA